MNTGLSTKSLKAIMIEPAVDDVLTKFIAQLLTETQQIKDYYMFLKW